MATTPNAAPTTANVTANGSTATTSTITLTANSTATLAAAQSAITQATGNAPANTFAVGSTTTISQTTPGGNFVQGSTTTPVLNAAAASSPPATNNGVSSVLSVQNMLSAAALAGAGLAVYNKVASGTNLLQTLVNNSNTVTPTSSTNNVQDPAQAAQAAEQAATTVNAPNTNSTNNVTDPAQRAQVADQVAIDNAQNVSTLQDPAQRQQADITTADNTAPAQVSTFSDPAQQAQANQAAIENADNTAPVQVSTFSDPAQRQQAADQVAIDQAAKTNNITDPAQRAQANQIAIENADNTAPVQVSTFSDPAQRQQAADQIAIDQAQNISTFQDPSQRGQAAADAIQEQKQAELNNEFAGVDTQVANNSYIDQPATVSDAEVEQQLQTARDENIENREPRIPNDEEVDAAIQAAKDEAIQNDSSSTVVTDDERINRIETAVAEEEAANQSAAETNRLNNTNSGLTTKKLDTQSQATQQDAANFQAKPDWRVRLSLSPGAQAAKYLYWANPPGILAPLQATDGVIFPYTPAITVQYNASYDPTELTHSNYKFFTYRGSAVDSVTIGCDFTAQDTFEANYLLAVIHFFKSVTKMFYGQDQTPSNGTPPPLCYLSGLGAFQFDAHPLAITGFTYTLPTDVDYIKAGSTATPAGVNRQNNPSQGKPGESLMSMASATRLETSGINPGGQSSAPNWQTTDTGSKDATYVPTKINLTITAVPIVTRNDISNKFSLKEYATGALLRGTKRSGGGIW